MLLLFERAMLWGLIELQRNPIELVKIKGTSKRQERPRVFDLVRFQALLAHLKAPYKTMVTVGMCTGLEGRLKRQSSLAEAKSLIARVYEHH
jgi:hypothetical protein